MKILRCIRSVNPECGGPIEGIQQVSRVLRKMGHDTEIACLDVPTDPWVSASPTQVHALGNGRTLYGLAPRYVRWLRGNFRHYDAIVVSGLWQFHALGAWLALRGTGMPYHVFPHGMLDPWFKRQFPVKHLRKWLYWPWADYRVLRDARAVLFTCDEERRLARESFWLYRCSERVVNYGTAAPVGDPEEQSALFLNLFPKLREKRLALFLGRLNPKKGCDILLRGFAEHLTAEDSHDRNRPWHLVIAGPDSGGWRLSLEQLVAELGILDRVTFTGMLQGDLKWGAFRSSELFVLPSHQENFGIAVVEALAAGLPVVVSPGVNIWREIAEDQAGWVCEPNPAGIRGMLGRWSSAGDQARGQLRENAGECFRKRFEISRVAASLLAALQR